MRSKNYSLIIRHVKYKGTADQKLNVKDQTLITLIKCLFMCNLYNSKSDTKITEK